MRQRTPNIVRFRGRSRVRSSKTSRTRVIYSQLTCEILALERQQLMPRAFAETMSEAVEIPQAPVRRRRAATPPPAHRPR